VALAGDPTWIHASFESDAWGTPGGDFDPAITAVSTIAGEGRYRWEGPGLATDVQSWLDAPSTNFGWIAVGREDAPQTSKRFLSREAAAPESRPALTIVFTPGRS
jgi:hypothetical protein